VGTQRPDGKSALLHLSLTKLRERCEKKTTGIMEKRVDFAPGQRTSPQRPPPQCNHLSLMDFVVSPTRVAEV
jgi:hypothetical protein